MNSVDYNIGSALGFGKNVQEDEEGEGDDSGDEKAKAAEDILMVRGFSFEQFSSGMR
jgi:hypothetical protein